MQKPIKDGLTRYRSQATAQSSAGMTSLLRPAEAIEKTQPERLSFPRNPHSGRPRSAIPDTKRLHEEDAFRVSPNGVRDGGCLSAMRARRAVVVR